MTAPVYLSAAAKQLRNDGIRPVATQSCLWRIHQTPLFPAMPTKAASPIARTGRCWEAERSGGSRPIAEVRGNLLSIDPSYSGGGELDFKREAAKALEALGRHDKFLLSYFCEWLILNRAIADANGVSPIESVSAIATSVQRFLSQTLPEEDANTRHALYLEMTNSAWQLGYPQRFFKFEPNFRRTISHGNGS